MRDEPRPQIPVLEEYHFHSQVPVLGPLISALRNAAYNLAARWGVLAVITRQNDINAQLIARLQEYEERLIDQDRDLALLARTVAEMEIRQRFLSKALAHSESEHDG